MEKKRSYLTPALPRNRQVVGPQGDFGIIAKAAGHGKKRLEILDQRRYKNDVNLGKTQWQNQNRRESFHNNFWSSADVHGVVARIKRFVDKGLEAADDDLDEKRNRVKAILLEEEAALTQEYVDKAQRSADLEFEMKKKCAEEIMNSQATEEKAFVDDAYNRIFEESNDEFRVSRSAKLRQELNKIHKLQMKDKELVKLKEEENVKMWLAVMDKEQKAKELREQGEIKERKLNFEKNTEILKKQIFGIKLQRENEANLRKEEMEFWRDVNDHNEQEAELFHRDQREEEETYWKALKEQLEINRVLRERKDKEEKNIEQLMFDYNSAVLKEEKEKQKDNRERERMEQHLFRESLRQFNAAMVDLENESENFIKKETAEKLAAKRELKMKAIKMRKDFYLACARERAHQAEIKKRQRAEDARKLEMRRKFEGMICAQNEQLEKAKLNEKVQSTMVRDRAISVEQIKYQNLLVERAEREDREFLEQLRQNQEKDLVKSRELLANPRPGTIHPVIAAQRVRSS